jgi:hypothetical protein
MVFKQLHGLQVAEEEFIPFGGMGEDRWVGIVCVWGGYGALTQALHGLINKHSVVEGGWGVGCDEVMFSRTWAQPGLAASPGLGDLHAPDIIKCR